MNSIVLIGSNDKAEADALVTFLEQRGFRKQECTLEFSGAAQLVHYRMEKQAAAAPVEPEMFPLRPRIFSY